jgi:hypothetical protein
MKKMILILAIILVLGISCGTMQQVTVQEMPVIAQAAQIGSIGVAKMKAFSTSTSFEGLSIRIGAERYWGDLQEDMYLGTYGVIFINALQENDLSGNMYSDYLQESWLSALIGKREYSHDYGSFKTGFGTVSNVTPEGTLLGGFQNVIALDEVVDLRLLKAKEYAAAIEKLKRVSDIDSVLACRADLGLSVIEIIQPYQMGDTKGDFYLKSEILLTWQVTDRVTGEELFHDVVKTDVNYSPASYGGVMVKLPADPGDVDALRTFVLGKDFSTIVEALIDDVVSGEMYKFLPFSRTYLERVED